MRIVRLAACVVVGLVAVLVLSVALVATGVLRNPIAPALAGDIALAKSDRLGLRVLFVGNSFTFENSMPALVHRLAAAHEHALPVFAVQYVAPGWNLRGAASDEKLAGLIRAVRWDAVVLQEASWIPALPPEEVASESTPFAFALDESIRGTGSRTVLFMTWGYRHGHPDVPGDTYDDMQQRLARGYSELGTALSAPVAPVGLAWAEALSREPGLDLWARDGRHPSRRGSYLAACVLYAAVSGRDPRASEFSAGLDERQARFLRDVAADVVRRTFYPDLVA